MEKAKVFKILRIICCIVAALAVAACVFVFVYAGTVWGIISIVGAAAFFALTVLFKKLQEDEETKNEPKKPDPFLTSEDGEDGGK